MIINADFVWPIGSIYISVNSTNPSLLFGGTWELVPGRFLIGTGEPGYNNYEGFGQLSSDQTTWSLNVGVTGGEYRHTLTTLEMPSHTHNLFGNDNVGHAAGVDYWNLPSVIEGYNYGNRRNVYQNNTGATATGGGQYHNNMPPFLVANCWKRTG